LVDDTFEFSLDLYIETRRSTDIDKVALVLNDTDDIINRKPIVRSKSLEGIAVISVKSIGCGNPYKSLSVLIDILNETTAQIPGIVKQCTCLCRGSDRQ
jgi:hypothetical protein